MVLKKSDLYSSLWKSCDELRGGMDASQYKDYILTLLFVKYVSDKAKADPRSLVEVPPEGSFDAMLAAKGAKDIGDRFNKIIAALAEANEPLRKVIDQVDFNDEEKLGQGKAMQDRLSSWSPFLPNLTSAVVAPRAMICLATLMNTSCGTLPPSLARARDSSTRQPRYREL